MAILRRATVKAPEPVEPLAAPEPLVIAFPSPSLDGSRWDAATHDLAVKLYEAALAAADPDAGRMRTLLGMYGCPGRELQSGTAFGAQFKG